MFISLLKDMVKDTDEQLDEEMHRLRSGRVLNTRVSAHVEMGCIILPEHGRVCQPGNPRTPYF